MAEDSTHLADLQIDADGRVVAAEFGSAGDAPGCFSLGACIVEKGLLMRLAEDACAVGRYNFVSDIIEPALAEYKVMALEHEGYAARMATVKSYFDVMRDVIDPAVREELFFERGPVYTRVADAPPVRYAAGCEVEDSVFGNGCDVRGRVSGSVVFRGVSIEAGADVGNSVVMQDSRIGEGAHLRNVIIDKDVVVEPGARVVGTPDAPRVVRKGSVVKGA